jgi:hypothetical protein
MHILLALHLKNGAERLICAPQKGRGNIRLRIKGRA